MATYKIKATYTYEGVVSAPTPERAEQLFLSELNRHYSGTDEFECVAVCAECEGEDGECDCPSEDDEECVFCALNQDHASCASVEDIRKGNH
jgi:hypothetical protein